MTFAALSLVPNDIHDIRGPISIEPWWRWPLAVALSAAAALAVVLVVRWLLRRRRRAATPLDRAREALASAEAHARAGSAHAWAEIVAPTVREALAVRLGTALLPETTAELSARLWVEWSYEGPVASDRSDAVRDTPPKVDAPRIVALLELCDLARYARASSDADVLVAATATARALVEDFHGAMPFPRGARLSDARLTGGVVPS